VCGNARKFKFKLYAMIESLFAITDVLSPDAVRAIRKSDGITVVVKSEICVAACDIPQLCCRSDLERI
jgi:hypothetical protein